MDFALDHEEQADVPCVFPELCTLSHYSFVQLLTKNSRLLYKNDEDVRAMTLRTDWDKIEIMSILKCR
jgi:hypothetical protein